MQGKDGSPPRSYKCRFCKSVFTCGKGGYWNLYGHRDGTAGRPPCPKRHLADPTDYHLPPTYREVKLAEAKASAESATRGTLDNYIVKDTFSVDLLNKLLVIWLVEEALAWERMHDRALRAAFKLSNIGATIRSASWAARVARDLWIAMKRQAIDAVKVSFCITRSLILTTMTDSCSNCFYNRTMAHSSIWSMMSGQRQEIVTLSLGSQPPGSIARGPFVSPIWDLSL